MRFQPHLLDEIRARLPVSQVVARKVALKKRGREFAGLSPFKNEKTPSFFVNDQKGFYHCFASGEHGDIFTFLMKTEGLAFPEAVERLAQEAGVELPKEQPRDIEVADARDRLYKLVELCAQFFEDQLRSPAGQNARLYLEKRGVSSETIKRFRIGYAPAGRNVLKEFLKAKGYSPNEMATSGMLIAGEDIAVPYDRFRDRLMFPICDLKGRTIAFGGRALDPSQPAKYLNSPETPLFHKGRILYNAHNARPAAFDNDRMIAVEGYMDVVALAQAGFSEAVAPLGTALTGDQISLMWRVTPEPILCFDGDAAGRKAAYRAIDTVLPHLKAGSSLSFAFLPDGQDPDDLIKNSGARAFGAVIDTPRPLVDVLFEREWNAGTWTTPERRAELEARLRKLVSTIQDPSVRSHYEREMRNRLFERWRADGRKSFENRQGQSGQAPRRPRGALRASPGARQSSGHYNSGANAVRTNGAFHASAGSSLKNSSLASLNTGAAPPREALIIRTLLNHPRLIDDHAEAIAALKFSSNAAGKLRDAILSAHALKNSLDTQSLRFHLEELGHSSLVDIVARSSTHRGDRFSEPDADTQEVDAGWADLIRLHDGQTQFR